ncbi:hypothetical protein RQM47_13045 [Rubrivirga sp. S365]|uniref:hypothetical protein n=1 Tax=Rubrivirga sp. S365 TaxID=3076080 RepID=UPI0028C5BF3F|nr:hypothetical protein [Rubrivirga sp. S365]MDT7857572.1 hypothetical protein [Rubrivirga sp. S365]
MRALLAGLVLVSLAAGCDSASDETAVDVTFRDEGGAVVSTGRLRLDEPLSTGATVSGTYRLSDAGLTPNQSGRLRATCERGGVVSVGRLSVAVDLDASDAGLTLEGACGVDSPSRLGGGTWSRITVAGAVPGGRFEVE